MTYARITHLRRLYRKPLPILLFVAGTAAGVLLVMSGFAKADFNNHELMDDLVFNNANTMTAAQIDSFLNSFPNSCISTGHGFTAPDPTGYSPSPGVGFTYGPNVSAGQVIYDAAQAYGLNPEVILATLQKEQGLVVGGASICSSSHAYNAAMGYSCPDSGSCPSTPEATGFSQQIIHATWLLRFAEQRSEGNTGWDVQLTNRPQPGDSWNNSDDPNTYYGGPMTTGTFARVSGGTMTSFDGYTTIDGTSVHMDTGATASLYNYTPHFAGNQNFETIFQSWFGPTTMADSYFAVVCDPHNTNLWFLLTATGKYYITGTAYNEWGLANYYPTPGCSNSANQVSAAFFDSLPTGPNLGNLLKDRFGNYFFIDNGQIHYISDSRYFSIWGLDPSTAAQSTGLVYTMAGGDWTGRFMTDPVNGGGQVWLMDGGVKHLVPANTSLLYQWGYTPVQMTRMSTAYLSGLTDGGAVTQFVTSNGSNFVVDTGRVLYFTDGDTQNAYTPQTPLSLTSIWTLSMLPLQKANVFVEDTANGQWFMLEGGRRHYVPNLQTAFDWGYHAGQPLLTVTDNLLASFTDGGTLTYLVQTSGGQVWVADGAKHLAPSASVAAAWVASGTTPPTYSAQSLDLLPTGNALSTLIQPQNSPFIYTLDNGVKRYLPLPVVVSGWGYPATPITTLSQNLVNQIGEVAPISVVVQNAGTYYLLMNGTAYPIDPTYADSWAASAATPQIASSTLARFTVASQQLGAYIKVGGTYYIMNNLYATPVNRYVDAYGLSGAGNVVTLPANYFATTGDASYLVQSTDKSDGRMWLINQGQKILLSSFAQQATYGYVSRGVPVTPLTPAVLAAIPTSTNTPSLLVTTSGAGVKLLSFGSALGFPDGPTLTSYVSASNPILTLSPSVYNSFLLTRGTTSVIRNDAGQVFTMQNGTATRTSGVSPSAATYNGTPITYLEGTTMALLPTN